MAVSKQQLDKDKELLLQSALHIGTLLQSKSRKYYVMAVLGGGGFGITYKVYANEMIGNIPQKIFFVIKEYFIKGCFRTENGTSVRYASNLKNEFEQSRADFVLEADRLNKLGKLSPNIVKVNEHFDANNTSYYVMEYLDGGDLRHYVNKNGALSESEALAKLIPIARAVEYLHKDGLLHLDIKPDNIVLKEDATTGEIIPVLIDFGIAKHFDKHGKPTSRPIAKGASDGYAPMEQYTEITKFAPEIDVYALGATLYFCLTNSNPPKAFDIPSDEILLTKLPNGISQRVKKAIVCAMQRSCYDRTKNVQAFLSSIEQVYTLPIGTELRSSTQRYRIIEILGETSLYIKYKAVLSNGTKTNHNDALIGNGTTVLVQYYIFEWFEKDKDKRIDSTCLQKQSFRDLDSECISVFAREMHKLIPNKYFVEKDDHGRFKAEEFRTNNTCYYSCEIMPKASALKISFELLRNTYNGIVTGIRKNKRLLFCLIIGSIISLFLPVGIIRGSELLAHFISYSFTFVENTFFKTEQTARSDINPKTPSKSSPSTKVENDKVKEKNEIESKLQPIEQKKTKETDDDLFKKAKSISDFKILADRGYKKAYYPLANKYFTTKNYVEAKRWANKCFSSEVDVTSATNLLSHIQDTQYTVALKESNWILIKDLADEGYNKAYTPLAEHYLKTNQYRLASKYARKGVYESSNSQRAKTVLDILKKMDYQEEK